jgi:type I restriction enzyme S subunit
MSFPRYPKYKDSGVEWLREVPEHWEVRRLRQIGPLLKGSGGSKEDIVENGVPCVRYGDLYTTHAYFVRQARTHVSEERAVDYFSIQRGDVLFAASGEDLAEIGRSAVILINERVCCGGDLVILRPEISVVPEFMGYACDCWPSKAQKASMGRGTTVKHIYPDELKTLLLALPPYPEQAAIAAFLDRETAKIDALIAAFVGNDTVKINAPNR